MIAANRCQNVLLQPVGLGQMQAVQRGVDDAAVGEHEAPAEDRDEGGDGPRQDEDQPVEGAAAQLLVEQQRQAEADRVVEGDAERGPDDRPDEVRPEAVVRRRAEQDVLVVVEPDELVGGVDVVDADRARGVEAVGVGERQVEAVHQGVEHEDAEHDDHGDDHRVRVPVLLVGA
jgi:hypothetical protein